jgi:hypothetical protein
VKPDATSKTKISSIDAKVKTLGTKLDSYVSKLELLISKEKDKKKQDRDKDKEKGKNGRGWQDGVDQP